MINLTLNEIIIGIIAAVVVTIISIIVVRLRNRIQEFLHGLKETIRFANRISRNGLNNFYVGRDDWTHYRNPPNLSQYLKQAKVSIKIACYWMAQGTIEGIPKVCSELAESGIDIEIVIIEPKSTLPKILSLDLHIPENEIRSQVKMTLQNLNRVKNKLSENAKNRFKVKVSNSLPQAAIIMIDPCSTAGKIQLEFRPYNTPRWQSFSIELKSGKLANLYNIVEKACLSFFSDAREQ